MTFTHATTPDPAIGSPRCERVIITGSAGFVGAHLIRELESHGHKVFTTDALPADSPATSALPEYRQVDLRNREEMCKFVSDIHPDACIHLGAISYVPDGDKDPSTMLTVNIAGTVNVAEALRREAPDCRMLMVSTSQVYGPVTSIRAANVPIREMAPLLPLSMYAISKVAAEHAVSAYNGAYGLQTLIARPANHTGPGQTDRFVAVSFAKQVLAAKRGEINEIKVGNLDSIRDFTDVRDVVRAYRLIIERGQNGQAYNITTHARVKIGELLDSIKRIVGAAPKTTVDPALYRPSDASLRLDVSRIREHTGWSPSFSLEHTITDIINNL